MRYLLILLLLTACATERNALVEAPKHYEDNSVFTQIDGVKVECRKPYRLVKGKPTNCRPSNEWPDGGVKP